MSRSSDKLHFRSSDSPEGSKSKEETQCRRRYSEVFGHSSSEIRRPIPFKQSQFRHFNDTGALERHKRRSD